MAAGDDRSSLVLLADEYASDESAGDERTCHLTNEDATDDLTSLPTDEAAEEDHLSRPDPKRRRTETPAMAAGDDHISRPNPKKRRTEITAMAAGDDHTSSLALLSDLTDDADGEDYFSLLTDDILRVILRYVPAKQGAFTRMLSRRWRPLWTSSGAVNLVARILEDDEQRLMHNVSTRHDAFYTRRDAFVAGAHKVLDAFHNAVDRTPVTTLTFRVEGHSGMIIRDFLNRAVDWHKRPDVVDGVLSHPAVRVVEELRIAAVDSMDGGPMLFERIDYETDSRSFPTIYKLNLASLPSQTIRVLDLTNCSELVPASPPVSFPCLTSLRLQHCNLPLDDLQRFINAAPLLASIYLDSVLLEDDLVQPIFEDEIPEATVRSLRCPSTTTLVIYKCCLKEDGVLQIRAPMLRLFKYKGVIRNLSLSPPPPKLVRAEIALVNYRSNTRDRDQRAACNIFWGFVGGFSHAKELDLSVPCLDWIAVRSQFNLLPALLHVERLELEGMHWCSGDDAMAVIANLLCCCPALRDLWVKLWQKDRECNQPLEYTTRTYESEFEESEFEESMERFRRRKFQQPAVVSEEVESEDEREYDEIGDIPGLSGRSFTCLQSCLRIVRLQFRWKKKDCFGIKLVKFFAENAKVIEKIYIDDGDHIYSEHIHYKFRRWRRNIEFLSLTRR